MQTNKVRREGGAENADGYAGFRKELWGKINQTWGSKHAIKPNPEMRWR